MAKSQSPAITRRRLRTELKTLREGKGLSQNEVVKKLDWSLSKLTRIENGSVRVSVTDTRALLTVYEAPDSTIEELVSLARAARERRWWSQYRDILPPHLQEFLGFEADAIRLRHFQPITVPGLLQTEAYARTLAVQTMMDPLPEELFETWIEVRLRRQKEVLGGSPASYTVVLDEGVLRRQVGGVDGMRDQLAHITALAAGGTISLGILPFSAGAHFGMTGGFQVLEFTENVDDPVLYLENAQGGSSLQGRPDLAAQYGRKFEDLSARSVRGDQALDLLRKVKNDMH